MQLEPIEEIAFEIARADMHYVASSLIGLPPIAAAAEVPLLQYGVMAAYESKVHFAKTLGLTLETGWNPDAAATARNSGKFFADSKRNLQDVIDHFELLMEANHGAFFPPDRRGRVFDFLRDDLSVITLDGSPYVSLLNAHYLTGLKPQQVGDVDTVGPAIFSLSTGLGNIAGALLHGSGIEMHSPGAVPSFVWMDGKSKVAIPRLFAGQLSSSLALALQTVHSVALSAANSPARSRCDWCEMAANKHRFVALFQSVTALVMMRDERSIPDPPEAVTAILDSHDATWLLKQSRLRNGLIHLGLQDIASSLSKGDGVDVVVRTYSGLDPTLVSQRVNNLLSALLEALTTWMLEPDSRGNSFLEALRTANID